MNKTYAIGIVVAVVMIAAAALLLMQAKPSQCSDPGVIGVSSCSDGSLKVMSSAAGAGFSIVRPDGTEFSCPVIAQPSDECMAALNACSDVNMC